MQVPLIFPPVVPHQNSTENMQNHNNPTSTSSNRPRRSYRIIAFTLTIMLLAWVIWKQDWEAFTNIIASSRGIMLMIIGLISMLMGQIFGALRWAILLRAHNSRFKFSDSLRLTLIGSFASLILPTTTGGDVVRIVGLSDRDYASCVASVTIDRLVSISATLSLLPLSLYIIGPFLGAHYHIVRFFPVAILLSLGLDGVVRMVRSFFNNLMQNLLSWRNHPIHLGIAYLFALASNGCGWASVWILASVIDIHATYLQVVAAGVWIYIAGLLPISINGLGVQEAGYIYLYSLWGVKSSTAATLGILTRLIYILSVLPGGMWLMFNPTMRKSIRGNQP